MKTSNCTLCAIRPVCNNQSLVLQAPAEILANKLLDLFILHNVRFQREGTLFLLHEADGGERAMRLLATHMNEAEREDLLVGHGPMAKLMRAGSLETYLRLQETDWFDVALREDQLVFHYQPIVNYELGSVYAHECLVRMEGESPRNGEQIVNAAFLRKQVHAFDSYCRQKAIRSGGTQWQKGTKLFVNFLPSSIYDPNFCLRSTIDALHDTPMSPGDIVFEVVESEKIHDVKRLQYICDFYRERGFQFAMDDVGAGANSLQMICELQPHYVKIDKSLTRGWDQPRMASAIQKLAELSKDCGAEVIVEGIENEAMATTLHTLGLQLMQGWHFGRPAPMMKSAMAVGSAQ